MEWTWFSWVHANNVLTSEWSCAKDVWRMKQIRWYFIFYHFLHTEISLDECLFSTLQKNFSFNTFFMGLIQFWNSIHCEAKFLNQCETRTTKDWKFPQCTQFVKNHAKLCEKENFLGKLCALNIRLFACHHYGSARTHPTSPDLHLSDMCVLGQMEKKGVEVGVRGSRLSSELRHWAEPPWLAMAK